jgi:hypothetical protein
MTENALSNVIQVRNELNFFEVLFFSLVGFFAKR